MATPLEVLVQDVVRREAELPREPQEALGVALVDEREDFASSHLFEESFEPFGRGLLVAPGVRQRPALAI